MQYKEENLVMSNEKKEKHLFPQRKLRMKRKKQKNTSKYWEEEG